MVLPLDVALLQPLFQHGVPVTHTGVEVCWALVSVPFTHCWPFGGRFFSMWNRANPTLS